MVSVGLGELGVEASISHLMSHASFKAGLFLAAGVIITSSGGYRSFKLQTFNNKTLIFVFVRMGRLYTFNLIGVNPRTSLTYNRIGQS